MSVCVKTFVCCCLIFIICCRGTLSQPQMVVDCCLAVKNQTIPRHMVVDYNLQTRGHGCSITATILVTRRNRKLCVPADEPWVQQVTNHVDKLIRRCNGKRKSRSCVGVKTL